MSGIPHILMVLGVSCHRLPNEFPDHGALHRRHGHHDIRQDASCNGRYAQDDDADKRQDSENTVYLAGVAPTLPAKHRAVEIARQVDGDPLKFQSISEG